MERNPKPDNEERSSCSSSKLHSWFKAKWEKIKGDVVHIGQTTKQLAKDDPRRITHSLKVGLAISLVSLFYYSDPLYEGFGVDAMWAVLTVVVVFEYSVGATLGKGVNRVLATIIGGMFAVGVHRLSSLPGDTFEPALLGLSVFLLAAVATFIRFFPKMKARFDYGLTIFILTFSLLCVSGYRDDEVIDMAIRRITTILIGCLTAMIICVVICPVWAGSDLHKLVASDIDKLGDFLLEFGGDYFKNTLDDGALNEQKKESLEDFKSVVNSKSNVDTLVNFAKWEPWHGRFKKWHPWEEYQKIGELTRHCACKAETLHGYLLSRNNQAPREVKDKLGEPCTNMSTEAGKSLKKLSQAMKEMTQPLEAKLHVQNAKQAAENLSLLLRSPTLWNTNNPSVSFSDVTPAAAVTYLLYDVVTCAEEISGAVQELASRANFKNEDKTDAAVEVSPSLEGERSRVSTKWRFFSNHVRTSNERSLPSRLPISRDPPSLAMSRQVVE